MLKNPKDLLNGMIIKMSNGFLKRLGMPGSPKLTSCTRKTRPTKRNCFSFDMSRVGSIENMFFFFKKMTGSVQIVMESSNLFADRDLSIQSRYRNGHDIVISLQSNVKKTYDVKCFFQY